MWRVAANIFNKQSRTGDKGWCLPAGKLGEGLTNPRRKISACYEILHIGLELTETWKVRSFCSSGSLGSSVKIVARELEKYGLDLLGVQVVRWDKSVTAIAESCTLRKREWISSLTDRIFFCQKRNISAVMIVEFISDRCHIGDTSSTKNSPDYRLLGGDNAKSTRYVPAFERNMLFA
jgi:hypothetical protein